MKDNSSLKNGQLTIKKLIMLRERAKSCLLNNRQFFFLEFISVNYNFRHISGFRLNYILYNV